MVKTYEFSYKGLQQAFMDNKIERMDKAVKISFWLVILGLYGYGVISTQGIIKMCACSSTSKIVKYLIN